jgi:hypothetical protein
MTGTMNHCLARGICRFCNSYDIACKHSKHFEERVSGGTFKLIQDWSMIKYLLWLIGKFHLGGHKDECAKKYSFNYNRLVGRMSGELVETIWSYLNWFQYQTREMDAGVRKETLTVVMNDWNWRKVIKMGE